METPSVLRASIHGIEQCPELDRAADALGGLASTIADGRRGDALRGTWIGHSLHPLLTDFPFGCWLAAGLLDLVGGRRSRAAATRLIGLGALFAVPTAAAGAAEYDTINRDDAKRIGVVHAVGNGVVTLLYLRSWTNRRRGAHWRGVGWAMVGGTLAWATGYLGGHLSLVRSVGSGDRGIDRGPAPDSVQQALFDAGGEIVEAEGDQLLIQGPNSA